jgi:alanine racemase
VQRRTLRAGESVGYNATYTAQRDTELAILNVGYATAICEAFPAPAAPASARASPPWSACVDGPHGNLRGRCAGLAEGDWVELDYDLPAASAQSALSQYELLTCLGRRYRREWF